MNKIFEMSSLFISNGIVNLIVRFKNFCTMLKRLIEKEVPLDFNENPHNYYS
jgi:hypothetical protein